MPSGKPAPKKTPTTAKKTAAQIAAENARIAHMTAGGTAPPNRPGNAASSYTPSGPLMSPPKAWQPLGTNYLGPQTPNHTGPTSNVPPDQILNGWTPELMAAIKAQQGNATGGFPPSAADAGAAGAGIGQWAAQQAQALGGAGPADATGGGGGGGGAEAPADPGFVDPYAAQKAAFEQTYQQAIPQLDALRALYAQHIQGYGQDAQAQAGTAQSGIAQAIAQAQAQNQQGAQGLSADLTAQGFSPAPFNAQAGLQQGLLANQGTLQDALSKRLAQVQGQQTQSNLTASDLASQGARQNLEAGHVAGQAAYTDKTAAAQNDYQTALAQAAAKASAGRSSGGGGGGGSSKNASGLTAYQQAQLDKGTAKDKAAAEGKATDYKRLGGLVTSATGLSAGEIKQGLADGRITEADLLKDLKDNAGLTGAGLAQALASFHEQYPATPKAKGLFGHLQAGKTAVVGKR